MANDWDMRVHRSSRATEAFGARAQNESVKRGEKGSGIRDRDVQTTRSPIPSCRALREPSTLRPSPIIDSRRKNRTRVEQASHIRDPSRVTIDLPTGDQSVVRQPSSRRAAARVESGDGWGEAVLDTVYPPQGIPIRRALQPNDETLL